MRKYILIVLFVSLVSIIATQARSAQFENKLTPLKTKQYINSIYEADMRGEIPRLSRIQIRKLNFLWDNNDCTEKDILAILYKAQGGLR